MKVTFSLFDSNSLRVTFEQEHDSVQQFQHALGGMLQGGWTVTEPVGNAKEKIMHITGWVLTETEDKRLAKFMPSVLLFSDYGEYAQVTVFHENLSQLSSVIETMRNAKKWDSGGITRGIAQKKGYMNQCSFDAVLEPKLDLDGNPKTNAKGYVQYKFSRVKGAAPAAQAANDGTDFTLADVEEQNPDGDLWKPNTYSKKPAAAKPKAFEWPINDEMLSIAAGVIQMNELQGDGARLLTYVTGLHHDSKGKMTDRGTNKTTGKETGGQYGFIASLLDKRYGNNSHRMILSALCGEEITSASTPGYGVKEIIDWLVAPEENKVKLAALDQVVAFVKEVVAEVEEA